MEKEISHKTVKFNKPVRMSNKHKKIKIRLKQVSAMNLNDILNCRKKINWAYDHDIMKQCHNPC